MSTRPQRISREERRRLIEEETARCIELYREHESADTVAETLGVKRGRVLRRLREANVSLGMLRVEHTVALFRELGSIEAVAERQHLSEMTVRGRLFSGVVCGMLEEAPEALNGDGLTRLRLARKLDREKERETVALYRELRSLRAVGKRLGLTAEGVRQRLLNAGVETKRADRLTSEERDAVVQLYGDLQNLKAVATSLGRSPVTVRRVLERAGVTVKRGAWHETRRPVLLARKIGEAQVMKRLFDQLGSETLVAEVLGVSQTLVSTRLQLLGAAPGRGNHGRRPRLPDAYERARSIYEETSSPRETAARLGVSYRTALRYLHAAGAELRCRPGVGRPLSADDIEHTFAVYRATYSIEETARQIGRSQRTTLRHIQKARELRRARRAAMHADTPVPLEPPSEWERPARLPIWMREEELIWADVDDLRTLERTAQGKFICPLCGMKTWGISLHLRQPHARCREPGCEKIVLAAGVPAHHWGKHVRTLIEPGSTGASQPLPAGEKSAAA